MMANSIAIFAQVPGIDPKAKVMADAKKEAKAMAKDGWKVIGGDADLVSQLDLGMKMAYVLMEGMDGEPTSRYLLASSEASSSNAQIARKTARAQCEAQLVNALSSHVEGMVDHMMKNRQLSATEAETQEEMTAKLMSSAKGTLSQVKPVLHVEKKDGNKTKVRIQLAYDLEKLKSSVIR